MKIRIEQSNQLGGDTIFEPVDPPITPDPTTLFDLDISATATSARPFTQLAVNWRIRPIDPATSFDDYQFRLVVFQHVQLNAIQAQGSAPFTLMSNTRAVISARKGGGKWYYFDQEITFTVEDTECVDIFHLGMLVDWAIVDQFEQLVEETEELLARSEPTSDWTYERIRYDFPIEIDIDGFFNANLDVAMEIRFSLEHDAQGSTFTVDADFIVNASFSTGEHVVSIITPHVGAATIAIQETLNQVLPLVFDCRKPEIEAEIARQILNDEVREALDDLSDGRIYAVRIVPRSQTQANNLIQITVCPTSDAPDDDDDDTRPDVGPIDPN